VIVVDAKADALLCFPFIAECCVIRLMRARYVEVVIEDLKIQVHPLFCVTGQIYFVMRTGRGLRIASFVLLYVSVRRRRNSCPDAHKRLR